MSYVHEHHSLSWIVMPLREQLERLLCALLPVCHRKTHGTKACGFGQRLPQLQHETQRQPECPRLVQHTKHLLRLCIRGTLTCAHIPMRASHTSSMHIPRAHKAAWALKLPLSIYYYYFFFFVDTLTSHIHEFTPLTVKSNVLSRSEGFGVVL